MNSNVIELRQHPRVAAETCSLPNGVAPNRAAVVNVSHGGACLLLGDAPPRESGLAIKFQCDGRDHILRSRLVWSKRHTRSSDRRNRAAGHDWLAGVAFSRDEDDALLSDNPLAILRAQQVTVYPHAFENAGRHIPQVRGAGETEAEAIAFPEQAVVSAKAVAGELVPIFAKHFSSIHMVLTRDRLAIDATFRAPEHPRPAERPQVERRAEPPVKVEPVPARTPAVDTIEPAAASITPNGARTLVGSGLGLMAVSLIAAAILAATLLWSPRKGSDAPVATGTAVERVTLPPWASGVERNAVDEWVAVQRKFGLSDATMSSTLQLLRANEKYAAGQSLYDLTRYPVQVGRALALVASARVDLNRLMDDLQARVVQGVRFPDEQPGGPYSSLQRELFNNIVVLAVIDILRRRHDDPAVKNVMAALKTRG